MADTNKALDTMTRNIETKTGMSLAELSRVIQKSKLTKHGEIRSMLMTEYGLGHGTANTAVHLALKSDGGSAAEGQSTDEVLDGIYVGKKEHLRPVHERILAFMNTLGEFQAAPKKGYVSYRRKKQFAMVGPKTNSQVEVGLSAKELDAHARLKVMPRGSMCAYTTRLGTTDEVDSTLEAWIRTSYEQAG